MTYSLIAERRRHAPRGADGGEPGLPGRDTIDGRAIPGKLTGVLAPVSGCASKPPAGAVSARSPSVLATTAARLAERPKKAADLQGIWDFRLDFVSFRCRPPC